MTSSSTSANAVNEIRALYDRSDLPPDELRRRTHIIKGLALEAALEPVVGQPFPSDDLDITITSVTADPLTGSLVVFLTATRGGVPIVFPDDAFPFVYVNPPLVHDGQADPLQAAKVIIADTVNGFPT